MIAQLKGVVKFKAEKFLLIETAGVGYRVFVSSGTLKEVSGMKGEVKLWTHLYVRENALDLYGFLNYSELEFFEQLIQISGIGPKGALSVLAVAPIDVLKKAIALGETSYLTKVSGIGQRLAEKIILELKNKLGTKGMKQGNILLKEEEDVVEALQSLGYSLKESRDALRRIPDNVKGTENVLKEALKNVNK